MTFVYTVCFLLLAIGIILLLGLTPDSVSVDLMKFISPHQTLRDKALLASGKKKSHKLTVSLNRMRDALEATGKGNQFTIACAASLILFVIGCVAAIPFIYIRRTIAYYETHMRDELETALSIITTSYIRNDDIVLAVKENIEYLKPPVKDVFATFVSENAMITSDIRGALRNLKDKINDTVFREWCDTAIACQDDRTLKDTLMPIVTKLTDIRLVNNEIKGMLVAARTEYYVMAGMVVANIPMLYILNKDWYRALMYTVPGKLILGICALTIMITAVMMFRYTKPVEYKG